MPKQDHEFENLSDDERILITGYYRLQPEYLVGVIRRLDTELSKCRGRLCRLSWEDAE